MKNISHQQKKEKNIFRKFRLLDNFLSEAKTTNWMTNCFQTLLVDKRYMMYMFSVLPIELSLILPG